MSEELEEITKKLENHEERIARLEKLFQTKREEIEKKISIREFILSKNPKSEMDKALAVGYYFETYEGFTSFNVKDLENGFRRTKEKIPRNINYEAIRNIQKGYMMEAEEKKENRKAWYLTNSGMKYVENNFEQEK